MARTTRWPRPTLYTAIAATGIGVIIRGALALEPATVYAGVAVLGTIPVIRAADRDHGDDR